MALGKLPDDTGGGDAIFADINITPLTDIFLVLLIIFMVSSSVIVETASREGVKVNLPKGATKELDPGAKSLVVSILKSGEIMVAGTAVAAYASTGTRVWNASVSGTQKPSCSLAQRTRSATS
jgi:biopolymer transport protein ExbD